MLIGFVQSTTQIEGMWCVGFMSPKTKIVAIRCANSFYSV